MNYATYYSDDADDVLYCIIITVITISMRHSTLKMMRHSTYPIIIGSLNYLNIALAN